MEDFMTKEEKILSIKDRMEDIQHYLRKCICMWSDKNYKQDWPEIRSWVHNMTNKMNDCRELLRELEPETVGDIFPARKYIRR